MENRIYTICLVLFLGILYGSIVFCSLLGFYNGDLEIIIGSLSFPSLILFSVICFLGVYDLRLYCFFLFFVILAFPSPIDDLFPSVALTNFDDREKVLFPLITRIDFYLLIGIIIGLVKNTRMLEVIKLRLSLKVVIIILSLVIIINLINSADARDFYLVLSYSFHIRYLLLFILLLQYIRISDYQSYLINGLVFSLLFLLVESAANTYLTGADRLTSGSLSLNTFANISAAIGLFLYFLLNKSAHNRLILRLGILIVIIILIGSGTRGAFIMAILSFSLLYLLSKPSRLIINSLKISLLVITMFGAYLYMSSKEYLPERYSYEKIANSININLDKDRLTEIFEIELTRETSSIKSRIQLFESSLNMANANPLTGIGPGRWNRYKNDYLKKAEIPKVLLDPHNDYLALIAQYGWPTGIMLSGIVFFFPLFLKRRVNITQAKGIGNLYIVSFALGIAALSNAGFFKHQIAALLLFIVCYYNSIWKSSNET